jgi:hypothetical protein
MITEELRELESVTVIGEFVWTGSGESDAQKGATTLDIQRCHVVPMGLVAPPLKEPPLYPEDKNLAQKCRYKQKPETHD